MSVYVRSATPLKMKSVSFTTEINVPAVIMAIDLLKQLVKPTFARVTMAPQDKLE